MAGNSLVHNAEVKDKKCATCRHYEPSPLRKRGWCRNPLLYDRNTNHLVEEDTLGCSRGFGSVNYWEPLVLQTGRPALTRREKELARERELAALEAAEVADTATATISDVLQGPSQAELAAMRPHEADIRSNSSTSTVSNGSRIARGVSSLNLNAPPTVLRPAGSPAPSPNDVSPNRPRLRGGRPRRTVPATTPTAAEQASRPTVALPLTFGEKAKVFILARPWLPVLLILLLVGGGMGAWYLRSHNVYFKLGPLALGIAPTPTATVAPTALPTLVLVSSPTAPTNAPTATPPPSALPTNPPNVLATGGYASVTNSGLNVRDNPTTSGKVVDKLDGGTVVHIIGGPRQADGFDWWQVDSWPGANGKSGWCAAKFLTPVQK